MKSIIMKKALPAAVCTACVCFNVITSSGVDLRQFRDYDDDEMISVIVKVDGDPVLAAAAAEDYGIDYLNTDDAKDAEKDLEKVQSQAECYIEGFYPDLETEYSYTSVLNGFSCEIPESIVEDIEKCPQVVSVEKVHSYRKPQLYKSYEMNGADKYYESTGSYGEGETIAVLDTELDVTHPMFAPIDDKDVQFTENDIAAFAGSDELNADFDPEKVYVSSKLPFVYSYTNDDPYSVADENAYHGTHVSGIAAGNKTIDEAGREISGVAPDAQIVFMDIFSYDESAGDYLADDATIAAAVEDAVKLNVSVINLSLGSDTESYQGSVLDEAFELADNAGVTVCAAAGNEADGYLTAGQNKPENVDTSTVNMPSVYNSVISVASADNIYASTKRFELSDGSLIDYIEAGSFAYDLDELDDAEYVYCGYGSSEDFEDLDLENKIALCDRGEVGFEEKFFNAILSGAAGLIICDNIDEPLLDISSYQISAAFISKADGDKLKALKKKTISYIDGWGDMVSTTSSISSFSSWGVSEDLKLKPEITGLGGNVTSAGYNGEYCSLSGTSMATPYLAGCCALVNEYLKESGSDLQGAEKNQYIKNLLMNSAKLYKDDNGLYITPRRQGAGFVSLSNLLDDKVILTGDSGEAKIELYDKINDSFDMNVNVKNISGDAVKFKNAELVLTTDDVGNSEEGTVISGAVALDCTADLSSLKTIGAGESLTENIHVELDPSQLEEIASVFTNGFFIDGYILLSGAKNCCDISIPLTGFRGDWTKVPIFDENMFSENSVLGSNFAGTYIGNYQTIAGLSLSQLAKIMKDAEGMSMEELIDGISTTFEGVGQNFYLSPNEDYIGDVINYNLSNLREAYVSGVNIYDKSGNEIFADEMSPMLYDRQSQFNMYTYVPTDIADGEYVGEISGYINYPGAEQDPQKLTFDFTVDNTVPKINSAKLSEENGRKYVTLNVSDDNIEGIYVLGNGTGGTADKYDPDDPSKCGYDIETLEQTLQLISLLTNSGESDFGAGSVDMKSIIPITQYISADSESKEEYEIDFLDIIPVDKNSDGTMSVKYDVTDLESFSISVMDKAYNTAVYAGGAPVVGALKTPKAVKAGEKLELTVPDVDSNSESKCFWQISFDGNNWQTFDPEQVMTSEYNGAFIRYYAENEFGIGFSNAVKITVKGSGDNKNNGGIKPNANGNKNVNSAPSENPKTGAAAALYISAAAFGTAVATVKGKRKKKNSK